MIEKVFNYNQHFVAMMNIINAARLNSPENGHKHHIIPQCYYKMNNMTVDNSESNLVLLSPLDHQKIHKLAVLCVKDPILKSKMCSHDNIKLYAYHYHWYKRHNNTCKWEVK